jgi:hypothetical protein
MKKIFTAVLPLLLSFCIHAQTDTITVYTNKDGVIVATKDSAYEIGKFVRNGNLWHAKVHYASNDAFQSEGDYAEMNYKTPTGTFRNYDTAGTLKTENSYNNGKLLATTYFYRGGTKKSYISFDSGGHPLKQYGWDEKGNEIPGYVVLKEANYPGGPQAWMKYLHHHLRYQMLDIPSGGCTMIVSFVVDRNGIVKDVYVEGPTTNQCYDCADAAINIVKDSQNWEPAVLNGNKVSYRQRQSISFLFDHKKKKH